MSDAPVLLAVPNISEGRDEQLVRRIAGRDALLDVHLDPDHNRSVLTYGGPPEVVTEACSLMVERAAAALTLERHEGVHPRFGVVDVLPLVPYRASEEEAREVAADLSSRITQGSGIPVHTYGRASPTDRSLPELRRELRTSSQPAHPTAGVICIGIRDPLVAFNVNLDAGIDEARRIAREIRCDQIRALAFELQSRRLVQVSMNLVELGTVGPRTAFFERVAERTDAIVDAEVVGLVPQEVLGEFTAIPLRTPARSVEAASPPDP